MRKPRRSERRRVWSRLAPETPRYIPRRSCASFRAVSDCLPTEAVEDIQHILDFRLPNAGKNSDPKSIVDDAIAVFQSAMHAILAPIHIGLTRKITAEQQTRADLVFVQMPHNCVAIERRILAHGQQEPKPRRLGSRRLF